MDPQTPRRTTDPAALRAFFEPRAVAFVGASANPTKWGYYIFHNLAAGGFRGPLHPVNPGGGTLFGHPVTPSVDDLPGDEVDLALVAVPPAHVPECIAGLGRRGVRAAYVITGGYSETGAEGAARERELVALARDAGVLLAGPNGQGILSTPAGLCAQMSFARPPPGGLSVITQSGNMGVTLMHTAEHSGVGFCRLVSIGNAAALGLEDFLDFLAGDEPTRAIALYVEGVRDGRRFAETLRRATARKPIVLLKGGRTPGGAAAALSHTGALAGRADLFGEICRQLGAVVVPTIEDLFDSAAAFSTTPSPRGRRVGVVTVGGGWGVVAADTIQEAGLELAPLPEKVVADLDAVLPSRWSRRNPVDLAGDIGPGAMFRCVQTMVESGAFDAVVHLGGGLVGYTGGLMRASPLYPQQGLDLVAQEAARRDQRLGESLAQLAGRQDCLLVFGSDAARSPDAAGNPGLAALRARGIPVYPSPERAVRALAALARRGESLRRPESPPPRGGEPQAIAAAARELEAAARAGRERLAEFEAAALLRACGVEFPRQETAGDPDAAVAAAGRLGRPVVLKGAGRTLAHKSDRGLVRVGPAGEAEIRAEAARMLAVPGVEKLVVAERIAGRREILAGLVRDPTFGPVGLLGVGGVLTEALADAAFVLLPVTAARLRDAAGRLRAAGLFGPFRGEREVDCGALARLLNGLGELAAAAPSLAGVDLNPLIVRADGGAFDGALVAVDALIALAPAAGE